jgi:50S ribosomal subunit-associated GTPase HflX
MINNKCDLIGLRDPEVRKLNNEIWISAEKSLGIEQLRDRINKELFNGMFRGWVSIESSMGKLRSELYGMGCILKEENSIIGRVFLNIDIGREELDKLLENEGFNICSDEDILLANEG